MVAVLGRAGFGSGGFDAVASPLISWAFPNMAPARAKMAQARASEQAALAGWDVAMLRALRVVETGLTDQVLDDPQHGYTQLLVSSVLQV